MKSGEPVLRPRGQTHRQETARKRLVERAHRPDAGDLSGDRALERFEYPVVKIRSITGLARVVDRGAWNARTLSRPPPRWPRSTHRVERSHAAETYSVRVLRGSPFFTPPLGANLRGQRNSGNRPRSRISAFVGSSAESSGTSLRPLGKILEPKKGGPSRGLG
jgi:hypothetical protein